jgi:hypothetical protein
MFILINSTDGTGLAYLCHLSNLDTFPIDRFPIDRFPTVPVDKDNSLPVPAASLPGHKHNYLHLARNSDVAIICREVRPIKRPSSKSNTHAGPHYNNVVYVITNFCTYVTFSTPSHRSMAISTLYPIFRFSNQTPQLTRSMRPRRAHLYTCK